MDKKIIPQWIDIESYNKNENARFRFIYTPFEYKGIEYISHAYVEEFYISARGSLMDYNPKKRVKLNAEEAKEYLDRYNVRGTFICDSIFVFYVYSSFCSSVNGELLYPRKYYEDYLFQYFEGILKEEELFPIVKRLLIKRRNKQYNDYYRELLLKEINNGVALSTKQRKKIKMYIEDVYHYHDEYTDVKELYQEFQRKEWAQYLCDAESEIKESLKQKKIPPKRLINMLPSEKQKNIYEQIGVNSVFLLFEEIRKILNENKGRINCKYEYTKLKNLYEKITFYARRYSTIDFNFFRNEIIESCRILKEFRQSRHVEKLSKYALSVLEILQEMKCVDEIELEYRIKKCKDINPLPFDFKVKYKHRIILVEVQGEQHFEDIRKNGMLETVQKHDAIKLEYCKDKKIPLLIINYFDDYERKIKDFFSEII